MFMTVFAASIANNVISDKIDTISVDIVNFTAAYSENTGVLEENTRMTERLLEELTSKNDAIWGNHTLINSRS